VASRLLAWGVYKCRVRLERRWDKITEGDTALRSPAQEDVTQLSPQKEIKMEDEKTKPATATEPSDATEPAIPEATDTTITTPATAEFSDDPPPLGPGKGPGTE
jgi:hypothetical protein